MVSIELFGDNMSKRTSMQISEDTLNELHHLKNRGDSYEDVIKMLLLNYRESNNK